MTRLWHLLCTLRARLSTDYATLASGWLAYPCRTGIEPAGLRTNVSVSRCSTASFYLLVLRFSQGATAGVTGRGEGSGGTSLLRRLGLALRGLSIASGGWFGFPLLVVLGRAPSFGYQIGASGGITYNAPSGYHDDCVMALALANHRRWETENCGTMVALGGGRNRRWSWVTRRDRALMG